MGRKNKESDELLRHEHGHFDIGILCMNEIINTFKKTSFSRNNFQTGTQSLISIIVKKYNDMGAQYDKETSHSKNKNEQEKWNNFFVKSLEPINN